MKRIPKKKTLRNSLITSKKSIKCIAKLDFLLQNEFPKLLRNLAKISLKPKPLSTNDISITKIIFLWTRNVL